MKMKTVVKPKMNHKGMVLKAEEAMDKFFIDGEESIISTIKRRKWRDHRRTVLGTTDFKKGIKGYPFIPLPFRKHKECYEHFVEARDAIDKITDHHWEWYQKRYGEKAHLKIAEAMFRMKNRYTWSTRDKLWKNVTSHLMERSIKPKKPKVWKIAENVFTPFYTGIGIVLNPVLGIVLVSGTIARGIRDLIDSLQARKKLKEILQNVKEKFGGPDSFTKKIENIRSYGIPSALILGIGIAVAGGVGAYSFTKSILNNLPPSILSSLITVPASLLYVTAYALNSFTWLLEKSSKKE